MIRASHLAKGLDSDVGCQPCLNTYSDTWYHSVPSEQGSVVGMALYSLGCSATFCAVERVLGVGPERHVTVAR